VWCFLYWTYWCNYCYRGDSKLVTLAFKSQLAIPWKFRNRWNNCLLLVRNMYSVVSHIYREGNHVADKLTNLGLGITYSLWFDSCPMVFRSDLVNNRLIWLVFVFLNIGECLFVSPSYVSLFFYINFLEIGYSLAFHLLFFKKKKKVLLRVHLSHKKIRSNLAVMNT
jgi:hypothetical protein